MSYQEPPVSFLVLDYQRPQAARICLESLRRHVKLPSYKIIYLHNGLTDYPYDLLKEGLIDELIMPKVNGGLGIGTRSLFSACASPWAIYWQVDQIMGRDFVQGEFDALKQSIGFPLRQIAGTHPIISISLAGAPCGSMVFSERAFLIKTEQYRSWETLGRLPIGGAGPFHHLPWREGAIQAIYREEKLIHWTDWSPLAIDNGRSAIRENPDSSLWEHFPDTKALFLRRGPVKERYVYPKLSDREWDEVIVTQSWPPGKIPENEVKDSFHVWN